MNGWRPSALYGLVASFVPLLFFGAFALRIGPTFAKLYSDFGTQLPLLSRLAVHPMTSLSIIGFLITGIAAGALRPNERFIVLPIVAATGFVLGFATMIALYLPIFSLAGSIK